MRAYVIYGYEWSTDEKGAAPEVNHYRVAQVDYTEHDDLKMAIHSDFTMWRHSTRERVWKEVTRSMKLSEWGTGELMTYIRSFEKNATAHWYFLTEEEFQEWVAWAEGGDEEVEVCALQFNG